ncbi:MAG TPA: DUF1697 domain-containing protein [Gemmatimonadaceae bacterium]|nr:DUF1697 domain-containing protein [Gemmatimonadaceae bacterium]
MAHRYAAFLRAVSPMNCKMPELKKAFEAAGFTEVVTRLSSGNVVFSARAAAESTLARKAEAAMQKHMGRSFLTIVRPIEELRAILAHDPYQRFTITTAEKRIVTFLRETPPKVKLPIEINGTRILATDGRALFSTYVPTVSGPDFMTLIEKSFGKDITTRTWDTVVKVAR